MGGDEHGGRGRESGWSFEFAFHRVSVGGDGVEMVGRESGSSLLFAFHRVSVGGVGGGG